MSERTYPTTSRELFHGHHPACGYTVEGDPKACTCVVTLPATPPASGDVHVGRPDIPPPGYVRADTIEALARALDDCRSRLATPPASETVARTREALLRRLPPEDQVYVSGFEAAILAESDERVAALREALLHRRDYDAKGYSHVDCGAEEDVRERLALSDTPEDRV